MIPSLIDIGAPWKVLPPGIHKASLHEIKETFGSTEWRKKLFMGLSQGVRDLHAAGCREIFLDGSYVTEKETPGDYDACWDVTGVDVRKLNPVFLDFANKRANQKIQFLGEFFPKSSRADKTNQFIDYFQIDKYTGKPKGIISIEATHAEGEGDNDYK